MSDFKTKMHRIRFRMGLCPRPCWGSLRRSPDSLARFERPNSKGMDRRGGGKGEGRGGEGEEREGKEGSPPPHSKFLHQPLRRITCLLSLSLFVKCKSVFRMLKFTLYAICINFKATFAKIFSTIYFHKFSAYAHITVPLSECYK